jgi:predicted ferric reductase
MLSALYVCMLLIQSTHSHSKYRDNLPNSQILYSQPNLNFLGHQNLETKQLNWFGFDFAGNGYQWTKDLCFLDSDGDGQSNGLELGDPSCSWSVDQPNPNDKWYTNVNISHPGDSTSTTNRTMDPELLSQVTYHTPTVPHSGYTSLSYVLIPLGIAGFLGMLLTNITYLSYTKLGRNILQKRLGRPKEKAAKETVHAYQLPRTSPQASREPDSVMPPTSFSSQPISSPLNCMSQCSKYCKSEFDAKTWAMDLLIGEMLFLFAVIIGLTCLVINKQWNGKYRAANTLGQLAGTLCFLVVLPASRGAIWIWIFGIPFERAIKWHRLFGKLFVVATYLHVIVILLRYGPRMLADTIQWGPSKDAPYPYWGLMSGIGTLLIGITAIEAIRRESFELFYYVHIPMVQVIAVGAIFHAPGPEYRYPVIIAMVFYFIDVLGRFTWRSVNVVKTNIIDSNCSGVVKIRVVTRHALNIGPGDYFFLRFPQISFMQQHPFSVSTVGPHPNDVNFVIKSMGKGTFTDQLLQFVRSSNVNGLRTTMEGPYGHLSIRLEDYKHLWICCGGIGAAPMVNILMQLHERVMENDSKLHILENVHFCWVVRSKLDLKWFEEEINTIKNSSVYKNSGDNDRNDKASFHLHLFVTGSSDRKNDLGNSSLLDNDEEAAIELTSMMEELPVEQSKIELDDLGGKDVRKDTLDSASKKSNRNDEESYDCEEYEDGRPSYGRLFGGTGLDPDLHSAMLACGPSTMVKACQRAAMSRGWDIHKETFEF